MRRRSSLIAVVLCGVAFGGSRRAYGVSCMSQPDGTTCDAGTDGPATLICVSNFCVPCTVSGASPRFVDNSNGTITDRQTCLVWEKKDNAGGLHDLNNQYSWSDASAVFLTALNNPGSPFAGHTDWRLPTAAGRPGMMTGQVAEIESIQSNPPGCGGTPGGGCVAAAFDSNCGPYGDIPLSGYTQFTTSYPGCTIDGVGGPECSCTPPYHFWSASTTNAGPGNAWLECYTVAAPSNGLSAPSTSSLYNVRAVRGAAGVAVGPPGGIPELSPQAMLLFAPFALAAAWWQRRRLATLLAAAHAARSQSRRR